MWLSSRLKIAGFQPGTILADIGDFPKDSDKEVTL